MTTQTSQPIAPKGATPASEQMRADFESFVRLHFGTNDNSLNRAPEGYYNHVSSDTYGGRVQPKYAPVSMLWDTWQAALSQQAAAEPVARVRVHKTGGNAGLAWSAVPLEDAPLMCDGELLYAASAAQAPVQQEAQDLMKQKAAAFDEWIEKTNWVQEKINTFHVKSLGKHRADVMRDEIEYLRAKDKP